MGKNGVFWLVQYKAGDTCADTGVLNESRNVYSVYTVNLSIEKWTVMFVVQYSI